MSLDRVQIVPYISFMNRLDWDLIDQAAQVLNVGKEARKKWRQRRSIPHRWRIAILKQTNGKVSVFEESQEPRTEAAE